MTPSDERKEWMEPILQPRYAYYLSDLPIAHRSCMNVVVAVQPADEPGPRDWHRVWRTPGEAAQAETPFSNPIVQKEGVVEDLLKWATEAGEDDFYNEPAKTRTNLDALVALVTSLQFDLVEARRERDAYGRAIVSQTPDGSEFYKRDGHRYKVDIEACLAYLRDWKERQHNQIVEAIKARRSAEEKTEALQAENERLKVEVKEEHSRTDRWQSRFSDQEERAEALQAENLTLSRQVEDLTRERDEWKRRYRTDGVCEIGAVNPNVKSYMDHWEGRAEAAEQKAKEVEAALTASQAQAEALKGALEPFAGKTLPSNRKTEIAYDRHGLRCLMSPLEIAMVEAHKALTGSTLGGRIEDAPSLPAPKQKEGGEECIYCRTICNPGETPCPTREAAEDCAWVTDGDRRTWPHLSLPNTARDIQTGGQGDA